MAEDWAELGRRVRRERRRRGLTQDAFARSIGLSPRSVGSIERAHSDRYSPDTLTAIEDAMRWAPGSIERILAGAEPVEDPDAEHAELMQVWRRLTVEQRRMLVRVARSIDR